MSTYGQWYEVAGENPTGFTLRKIARRRWVAEKLVHMRLGQTSTIVREGVDETLSRGLRAKALDADPHEQRTGADRARDPLPARTGASESTST